MSKRKRSKPRVRRPYPKKFTAGYVNITSDDVNHGMSRDHENNPFTFRNRNVAASSGSDYRTVTDYFKSPNQRGVFEPQPVTETMTITRDNHGAIHVFYTLEQNISGNGTIPRFMKPQPWNKVVFHEGKTERVSLWFSGNLHIFIRESKIGKCQVDRSVVYAGRQTANKTYMNNRITWIKNIRLATFPPQQSPPTSDSR